MGKEQRLPTIKDKLETEYKEQAKRFRSSKESFSKERVTALRQTLNEVRASHPEVLGLALFGSMTKGTVREESDIDAWVFLDVEVLQRQASAAGKQKIALEKSALRGTFYLGEDDTEVVEEIRQGLRQRASLGDEQVKHIRSLPMSREIIQSGVQGMEEGIQAEKTYKEAFRIYKEKIDSREWGAKRPSRPEHVSVPLNLYALFHLAMGEGIRAYRTALIEELKQRGEIGREMWQRIIEATEFMEQGMPVQPTGKRYPRTLEEAERIYGKSS